MYVLPYLWAVGLGEKIPVHPAGEGKVREFANPGFREYLQRKNMKHVKQNNGRL